MLIATLGLSVGCGSRSTLQADSAWTQQGVTLALGTVVVGESVRATVQVPPDASATRTFARTFAPKAIEAPGSLRVATGASSTIQVVWSPVQSGQLDSALVYTVRRDARGRSAPAVFRIELSGTAVEVRAPDCVNCQPDAGGVVVVQPDAGKPVRECPRGENGVVCDDANPCTADRCVEGECKTEPALEGEDCGSFDCKVGHICAGGSCIEFDLSRHSDGMACDGGDPCLADGECKGGVCYASTEPRTPSILDRLPTYGERPNDAATDGELFVYAEAGRLDIAALQDGALSYRSSVSEMPSVAYVEALGNRQFLVRDGAGKVAKLDASDPLQPVLTALPHIVPKAVKPPAGATLMNTYFEQKWTVVRDVALLSTAISFDVDDDATNGFDTTYRLTAVPLDPTHGGPRGLDIHAYRMAVIGDTVTWTVPGYGTDGTQAVGIFQVDAAGKPTFRHSISADEASELGCGFPHDLGASGRRFVTLSTEDNAGYYRICLWQVAENPADGFELVKARGLDEHVHGCGIELDDSFLYLSCDTRNARGWLGELLEMGETVRYPIDEFIKGAKGLKFAKGEMLARVGGGVKTEIEAGYLWTIDDMGIALDLSRNAIPLSGPGFGRLNAIVTDATAQRALAGGLASFGVIEAVAGPTPRIGFGDWRVHYPRNGRLATDLRALRHQDRFADPNPMQAFYPDDNAEEVIATMSPGGAVRLDVRKRAMAFNSSASWRGTAVTADRVWLHDGALVSWTVDDGETSSQQIGISSPGTGTGALRTDASQTLLVSGDARGFSVLDPAMPPAMAPAPIALPIAYQFPAPYPFPIEHTQLIAVDGDHVLAGSPTGVELHSLGFLRPPVKLEWPDVDPNFAVALPLASEGNAIATYVAKDGSSQLVQLIYSDGVLRELARLQTDRRVTTTTAFGNPNRWLFTTGDGVQLADLMCWPAPEERE